MFDKSSAVFVNFFNIFFKRLLLIIFILSVPSLYSSDNKSRQEIVKELFGVVESWFGSPYSLGGSEKSGVDCSGFVKDVYKKVFDVELPRTVVLQKDIGKPVSDKFQPGDLLFFNTVGGISHVGIFVFDDKFIHAASAGPKIGVIKSSLNEKYYKERFLFARRVVTLPPYKNSNENKSKTNLVFYKFLSNGKLIDKSLVFNEKTPVYYKINGVDGFNNKFLLVFENISNNEKIEVNPNQINNDIMNSILLKAGNYSVKLFNDDVVVKKKEIIITSETKSNI